MVLELLLSALLRTPPVRPVAPAVTGAFIADCPPVAIAGPVIETESACEVVPAVVSPNANAWVEMNNDNAKITDAINLFIFFTALFLFHLIVFVLFYYTL